jgi:hypothetical protein
LPEVMKRGVEELELDDDFEESLPFIQVKEESDMQYNPVAMSVGTGHYREHPINFNSMLRESTFIKNLDTGSLIQNDIDHARALHKELEASADFLDLEGFDPYTGHYFKGGGNTIMNLEEMVTDGRAHIGALKLIDVPNFLEAEEEEEEGEMPIVFRRPIPEIEMDEVYQGTFQIKKNMRFNYYTDDDDVEDDWLPCCAGGWNTMPQLYQAAVGKDDKGVFDCTCYKAPMVAQFPRVY